VVSRSRTCLIFINQIREKIGVMVRQSGNHHRGARAEILRHRAAGHRRIAAIKDGDAVIGNRTKVKVVKNKVAAPFREAEFDNHLWRGDLQGRRLDRPGVAQNVIEKSGSWISYKGERSARAARTRASF